ncbi:unnamed protein product, partial [Amoebophrya sp. A120]
GSTSVTPTVYGAPASRAGAALDGGQPPLQNGNYSRNYTNAAEEHDNLEDKKE